MRRGSLAGQSIARGIVEALANAMRLVAAGAVIS